MNRNKALYLILTIYLVVIIVIPLFRDGMFMDALQYTAVAHNMSNGYGSFWHPEFSMRGVSGYDAFYEQPPLALFLLSLFYRIAGDSMYTERVFILIGLIISLFLIRAIWRQLFRENASIAKLSGIPILLFMITPIIIWTYDSFMLENVMMIWILASVYVLLKNADSFSVWKSILAALFIFLATFTKGIPGLFPLCVPVLLAIFQLQKWKSAILTSMLISCTLGVVYLILFNVPESRAFYEYYLLDRTAYRINNLPTVDSRASVLVRLFMELLPVIGLVILLLLFFKRKEKMESSSDKIALFFIAVGIAGSFPLMLTLIQKGFYLVPVIPFFAIGAGVFIVTHSRIPEFLNSSQALDKRITIIIVSALLVICTIQLTKLNTPNRDAELLGDLKLLAPQMERDSIIYSPNAMWNNWAMQCYLMRYYNKHMDEGFKGNLVIVDRSLPVDIPAGYSLIPSPTQRYDLYRADGK